MEVQSISSLTFPCSLGLGEDTSRFLFQQLILALDYCHKMNISNR